MIDNNYLRPEPKLSISTIAEFLGVSTQAVHLQLKNKGIKLPRIGNKNYISYTVSKTFLNLPFKKQNIVGQIVKGGTGKTTTIDLISSCANAFGARVLLIDADPQGNLTDLFSIDPDQHSVLIDVVKHESTIEDTIINVSPGLDLIPSRIENVILDNTIVNDRLNVGKLYKNILKGVSEKYDFIFIDCPPTLGMAVTAASLFADTIVAPLNPDKFSTKGLKILIKELDMIRKNFEKAPNFKVYLNKFSSKTILSDKTVMSLLSDEQLSDNLLSTTIQYSQEIPNLSDENKNVFSHLKKSALRDDYILLARELLSINPANNNINNKSVQRSTSLNIDTAIA